MFYFPIGTIVGVPKRLFDSEGAAEILEIRPEASNFGDTPPTRLSSYLAPVGFD